MVVFYAAFEQQLVSNRRELPPRRDVSRRAPARERGHEFDAFVENRHLLLARHCDRVLMRIAVDADLVPGVSYGFHIGGKCLDRVAGDKPCGLDAEPTEQLQEARTADLPGEQPARNIVGGVLTAVGAEPAGDSINIDTKPAQDLLRHRPSPAWCAGLCHPADMSRDRHECAVGKST